MFAIVTPPLEALNIATTDTIAVTKMKTTAETPSFLTSNSLSSNSLALKITQHKITPGTKKSSSVISPNSTTLSRKNTKNIVSKNPKTA